MKSGCRFEDLIAWQLAVELRRVAHQICLKPAVQRDFKFRDNLADAASSAPRNIAEGYGRKYHREFARFAIIARGSEQEVLACLAEAHDRGLIDEAEYAEAVGVGRRALSVLNGLISYLEATPNWGRE